MTKIFVLLFVSAAFPGLAQIAKPPPELNVIYGAHHIFTVQTPKQWINDKDAASTINLASFFYRKADSAKSTKTYMYAMGYDKGGKNRDLKSFIDGDLQTLKKKYPSLVYDEIKIGATGGIINAKMYSFDNLNDRYREEVVYMETTDSILVLSFAAFTRSDYEMYQPVFDEFVSSFKYAGNDPKPFLQWQKEHNN
jgi:hypothetical protein